MNWKPIAVLALITIAPITSSELRAKDESTGTGSWKAMEFKAAQKLAIPLAEAFDKANFDDLQVDLDPDPKLAVGAHHEKGDVLVVPIRDLHEGDDYPELDREPGCGVAVLFMPEDLRLVVDGKELSVEKVRQLKVKADSKKEKTINVVLIACRRLENKTYQMLVYGTDPKPLAIVAVGEAAVSKHEPLDIELTDKEKEQTELKFWVFKNNWSAFVVKRAAIK